MTATRYKREGWHSTALEKKFREFGKGSGCPVSVLKESVALLD